MARKKDADSTSADQSRSPILTGLTY
ncbi:MAG: hypothetical protein RI967_1744, partial [Planctomycetota bacterium]